MKEEPGESLSDCDKDEDEMLEEDPKADDEDESDDGFFVPDGYLSENEVLFCTFSSHRILTRCGFHIILDSLPLLLKSTRFQCV